jgi:hypothetical protein
MFPTGLGKRKDSFIDKDADLCAGRYTGKVSGNVCRLIGALGALNCALSVAKRSWSRWEGKICMGVGTGLDSKRLWRDLGTGHPPVFTVQY